MSRNFTHYWKNSTWFRSQEWHAEGDLLTYVTGNMFTKRGLMVGDNLYVVTVLSGQLYVCGKMMAGKICNMHDAAKVLGRDAEDLWEASEYVIASEATPMRFDLAVPLTVTAGLRFVNKNRSVPLDFVVPGQLDQQTLRGVRELEPSSALELDDLLPPMQPVNPTQSPKPRRCLDCGSLEARSALKEFFKSAAVKSQDPQRTKSLEAALLERVEKTRNEFEAKLNNYVDKRVEARLSQHEIGTRIES